LARKGAAQQRDAVEQAVVAAHQAAQALRAGFKTR
jgi:hypothetical protein